jgi:hypothetical protein
MKNGSPFLDAGLLPRLLVAIALSVLVWLAVVGVMQ